MTNIGSGFEPIQVRARWETTGHVCYIGERAETPHNPAERLFLVGAPIPEGLSLDDARATCDDMAATLKLAGEIRQQTNKARLFAEAVVTGLRRVRRSFAENEGARTTESRDQLIDATGEELDDLLAAALLVVENLGGGDAQRTRGGSKGPPGSDTLPK